MLSFKTLFFSLLLDSVELLAYLKKVFDHEWRQYYSEFIISLNESVTTKYNLPSKTRKLTRNIHDTKAVASMDACCKMVTKESSTKAILVVKISYTANRPLVGDELDLRIIAGISCPCWVGNSVSNKATYNSDLDPDQADSGKDKAGLQLVAFTPLSHKIHCFVRSCSASLMIVFGARMPIYRRVARKSLMSLIQG